MFTYQPERLHVVPGRWRSLVHVIDAAEARTVFDSGPFDEGLEHLPAPLSVLLVACDAPHVEQAFDCFWSLEIVGVGRLDHKVVLADVLFMSIR